MLQRDVFLFVLDVEQYRMALVERAATRILPAEPNGNPLLNYTRECQRLRHTVIHGTLIHTHFCALLEKFPHFRMNVESFRICREFLVQLRQFLRRQPCVHFVFRLVAPTFVFVPVGRQFAQRGLLGNRRRPFLRRFKLGSNLSDSLLRVLNPRVLSIDFPQRRMILN